MQYEVEKSFAMGIPFYERGKDVPGSIDFIWYKNHSRFKKDEKIEKVHSRLVSDMLRFYDNGNEVAYLSNSFHSLKDKDIN